MGQTDVVVVTGASRGVGKGVALALGRTGATVYVTGRSTREGGNVLPGTIEDTAEGITAAGGRGIAVRCDHAVDGGVKALFDRVERECGRLDLLVNNATALPRALVGEGGFWERSLELADMYGVGLRSTYVASYYAAPLMVRQQRGLIASISFYGAVSYFHGPAYGSQKAAIDKMMHDMSIELAPYKVACVSVWPGFVKTEMVLARWRGRPDAEARLAQYETPEFTGRVLNALLHDPALDQLSGRAIIAAEYGRDMKVGDADGKQPVSHRTRMGGPHQFFRT